MDRTTRVIRVNPVDPEPAALEEAAAVIRAGGLVGFPTETVYGLGADATNPEAVARIYETKGRPPTNPLIVHGDDVAALRPTVADWDKTSATLAQTFWPGPLTLVLPRSSLIPDIVTGGQDTVGVRVPDSEVARRLLAWVGRPVAAPSANRSTGVSPTTAQHVLKDLDGKIDLILDAGPTPVGIESTVLDLMSNPPRVLRPGAITAAQIGRVLGIEIEKLFSSQTDPDSPMSSPGQMEVHYSPRTLVRLIDLDALTSWPWSSTDLPYGLLVAGHEVPLGVGSPAFRIDWSDPNVAARELFSTLHLWDEAKLNIIYVVLPPADDAWLGVRDRLWRASRRWAHEGLE